MIPNLLPANRACESHQRNFSTFVVTEEQIDNTNCQPMWSEFYYDGLKNSKLTTENNFACIVRRPDRGHVWTECLDYIVYIRISDIYKFNQIIDV